jgi:zinc protease
VTALTRDDLIETYGRMAVKSRMKIGVVGDIDAATLGPLLDKTFGDLPEGEPLDMTPIAHSGVSGIEVIKADIPQSTVILGHEGIMRDDDDFLPAFVMNHIFGGGGFSSRLTEEVREKNGLAYSVYSYLNPMDRAGLYMGGVATANERVKKSIDLIRAEWQRLADEGVTEEELERAKKYLTGAFALRFDSNAKIARYLAGLQSAGLSIDYIDTRNDEVNAVTVEDIKRVAKRLLKPDDLFIVVVGNPTDLGE